MASGREVARAIVALLASVTVTGSCAEAQAAPSMASVLAGTTRSDWRPLEPENTLYLDLQGGRVVIELAPAFAPGHVANVKALVRERYFDGLTINRAQDNYVVQWGDPNDGDAQKRRPIKVAKRNLPAEFDHALATIWRGRRYRRATCTRPRWGGLRVSRPRATQRLAAPG